MASKCIHLLGSILALLGWLGVLLSCLIPMWRMTSFVGAIIVTAETIWEGIWMNCVIQSTGQMQCDSYDSLLALTADLKAAQVLTVVSLLIGSLGLALALVGGKFTNCLDHRSRAVKGRVVMAAGLAMIISAILCLIPVTWAAVNVVQIFYNPETMDAQRREIGPSIYIGWGASILLIAGGGMLCSTSCSQIAEDNNHSVSYRVESPESRSVFKSETSDAAPVQRAYY